MPRVQISIQDFPSGYDLVFIRDGRGIETLRLASEERVFELLRRTRANLETLQIVEYALQSRGVCMVEVNLNGRQLHKLQSAPANKEKSPGPVSPGDKAHTRMSEAGKITSLVRRSIQGLAGNSISRHDRVVQRRLNRERRSSPREARPIPIP